jgi:malate dehydrogenase
MKLGFVGAGRIGSTTAFTCLLNLAVKELIIVDIAEDVATGEAMDLAHAASAMDRYPKILGGSDYSLLNNSEIVVVTAGFARKPGMSRLDLATENAEIIREVARNLMKHTPKSKILVVTNPMDVMTYIMWKETGKPRNEVFGMGSLLDSSRLKERLHAAGVDIGKAYIIGEHGDTMFPAKSIAGLDVNWDDVVSQTKLVAAEIIRRKGATIFGPAVCIYKMVKAVVEDKKEEIPTSVVLQGEFGISDVALGLPVILGKTGVEKIVEYNFTREELESLRTSARVLKERLRELGY